jgi:tellurite resistance protein TerB
MPMAVKKARSAERRAELARELENAGDTILMEAVVSGCALVAYADGWVTPEEYRRMSGLIRAFEPVRAFGFDEVLAYFDQVTDSFTRDPAAGEADALARVARLKGRGRHPELLVVICSAIAEADGGFDAEERETLVRICAALDLDPADYDLVSA